MASEFRYPCTYVELGEVAVTGGTPTPYQPKIFSRAPHFHSQTRMLMDGYEAFFEHTVERLTRVDLITVTGPCIITNIRLGMFELKDLNATYAAPRRIVEVGHIVRITVKCMPELFMLPMVEKLQPLEGVPHD